MITKKLEAYLILNWKTGDIKILHKKPKSTGPYDIYVKLNLNINIPELKEASAEVRGEVNVPEAQVKDAILDELCDVDKK
jgi:hypothetical protein